MNTTYTKFSFKTLYSIFAIAIVALASACGKNDTQVTEYGSLSIYNASPSTATHDVYLNGSKLNSAALPYAGGVKYTQLTAGTYESKFTIASETASVYTKTGIAVGNNTFSTLYLTGNTGSFDGVLVTDDFGTPAADKAYVRFINLSPDATALDLRIKDATTNLASNQAFKKNSAFAAVDAGAKVFEIKETSASTAKTTVEHTLVNGKFYTIIAGGKFNPGNNERTFNGQVITHQ
ncbi:DUF4397 domain-containing protein [Pedobacter xixiisoli]|uniref:DUF4397 domain-containing protein n=1 Tax=Pedobacter xixiisoli TaxID=1476464 RepID=A0A286ADS6_9SPHI|nr:DUF4397 domain-containing protein [Pedobacter xixiisoli]SOD20066.1 protein of unknown function [Pedobacter xixiisoli]